MSDLNTPNIPTIKDILKNEIRRSRAEPVHFMKKYCYIQHPERGKIIFSMYDYQTVCISDFQNFKHTIILKSRQLGISTLAAGYALWLMLFHEDKNVLCIEVFSEA